MADPNILTPDWEADSGAHRVFNAGPEPCRVLLVSTANFPDVAEHLDTGAVLAMTGPEGGWVFPAGTDRPFQEAVVDAMNAAAG